MLESYIDNYCIKLTFSLKLILSISSPGGIESSTYLLDLELSGLLINLS